MTYDDDMTSPCCQALVENHGPDGLYCKGCDRYFGAQCVDCPTVLCIPPAELERRDVEQLRCVPCGSERHLARLRGEA